MEKFYRGDKVEILGKSIGVPLGHPCHNGHVWRKGDIGIIDKVFKNSYRLKGTACTFKHKDLLLIPPFNLKFKKGDKVKILSKSPKRFTAFSKGVRVGDIKTIDHITEIDGELTYILDGDYYLEKDLELISESIKQGTEITLHSSLGGYTISTKFKVGDKVRVLSKSSKRFRHFCCGVKVGYTGVINNIHFDKTDKEIYHTISGNYFLEKDLEFEDQLIGNDYEKFYNYGKNTDKSPQPVFEVGDKVRVISKSCGCDYSSSQLVKKYNCIGYINKIEPENTKSCLGSSVPLKTYQIHNKKDSDYGDLFLEKDLELIEKGKKEDKMAISLTEKIETLKVKDFDNIKQPIKYKFLRPFYVKELLYQKHLSPISSISITNPAPFENSSFITKMIKDFKYKYGDQIIMDEEFHSYITKHTCFINWLKAHRIIEEHEVFKPFSVILNIKTPEEFEALWHRLNFSSNVPNYDMTHDFRSDKTNELFHKVDEYRKERNIKLKAKHK